MLRISAKVDYAVRALAELARHDGRPVNALTISASQGIPHRFLAVTLGDLRRAGLIESRRGGEGGYWLAEPADTITISRVFEAIDGSVVEMWDRTTAPSNPATWLWARTEENLHALFDEVTIADVVRRADVDATHPDAAHPDAAHRGAAHLDAAGLDEARLDADSSPEMQAGTG